MPWITSRLRVTAIVGCLGALPPVARVTLVASLLVLATGAGAAPTAPSPGVAEARAAYERANRLYSVGEYEGALKAFKEAYLARPDPAFLYNMGQCSRMLKRWEDAERSYRTYLRQRPEAPNRADVEEFIAEADRHVREERAAAAASAITAQSAPEAVTPTTTPPEQSVPGPTPVYKKWWLWTAVVGGVL